MLNGRSGNLEEFKRRMIKALLKKIKEIHDLETKLAIYEILLTDEEKQAADLFTQVILKKSKGGDVSDPT